MMGRLDGKIALVTGAASTKGLGFHCGQRLAREGATVFVTDIDGEMVQARAGELVEEGGKATGFAHDVTVEHEWETIFDHIKAKCGSLDILVNNAGITIQNSIDELDAGSWNKVIAVNQTGVFFGCKHAMRTMRTGGRGGSIVNISSVAGLMGVPSSSAYSASKSAVRQLSKVVALEGAAAGIRCNTVLPGMIMSDIHAGIIEQYPDMHAQIVASIPMAYMGHPGDIANAVLFFASDEARYVTGAEIVVDGGLVLP